MGVQSSKSFGLGEGFEDEFIADAVGVAVGDGDAYLLFIAIVAEGWEK